MMLKLGVRLIGVRPEVVLALAIAETVWARHGADLVVTAVIDGQHKRSSAHYTGCAADLRVHGLADPSAAASDLRVALGEDFDVILEAQGAPNVHIHLEYDPKLSY